MKRPPRLVIALLAPFFIAWSGAAFAANCNNGKALWNKKVGGIEIGCAQSSCHGSTPANNMNNVQNGGASPANIQNALDTVPDMAGLGDPGGVYGPNGLTSSDLDDLGDWIFFAPNCPAAAPSVAANPTSASFGNINVGSSSPTQVITLTNSGAASATTMVYPTAPQNFSFTKTCGATIAAGASCTITFTFSPTAGGSFSPTYTVTGSGGTSVPISLSGTGVAASAPNVSASPTSLAFGNQTVNTTSGPQTITVSNTGNAAATNMSYPAAPAKFAKGGTCSGATLNAGASCTVTFTYTPTSATSDNPTYTITGGGASMPIALSGTGTAPQTAVLGASPTSLAFGAVTIGSTSSTQAITVSNTGGAAANSLSLASNSGRYALSGNTCGSTLAAGASCSVNVAYTPVAATSDNANLTISFQGGAPVVVSLTGSGTAAPVPNLTAQPGSLAFGSVTVGSTSGTQTVTVRNGGGAQANAIAFANSNAAEFPVSANTCGATLAAGATCTLNVAYSPAAAGADSASLTISYTGGTSAVVSLSGTGTAPATANLTASPPLLGFGTIAVGQSSAASIITITNGGGAAASGVSLANSNAAEFIVSGNTCGASLGAGASCTFSVKYTPGAPGADSATLTFSYGSGGALSISLNGTGITPPPPGTGQLSMVTTVTMPDQTLGTTSAAHPVTVSNIGSVAVAVSAITSSNAAEFAVSGSTCASVAASAACTFNVTFSPNGLGSRTATITITSNGTNSPQTIAVTGNGLSSGVTPPPATVDAIEYYHASFDHYFMTAIADEITKLDNGTFVGWARTGRSFKVYPTAGAGRNGVCRFFSTAFAPKSSHFYTPDAPECAVVKNLATWMFEDVVFYVTPASDVDGACPAGTNPVYRMYNDGQGAAPNHRYTTDLAVRADMLSKGWIPEGYGKIGVIMCSPP